MTTKATFDLWLRRSIDYTPVLSVNALPGTTHLLEARLWFRHATAEEFQRRLAQIVVCYPNDSADEIDECDAERVREGIATELHKLIEVDVSEVADDVLSQYADALDRAQTSQCLAHPPKTFRWSHATGVSCDRANGCDEWSRLAWKEGTDFSPNATNPTEIRLEVLQALATNFGNAALAEAIEALRATHNPPLEYDAPGSKTLEERNSVTPRKLTPEQVKQVIALFRAKTPVATIAKQYGVARTTIDRYLANAGLKTARKRSERKRVAVRPLRDPRK